MTREKCARYLPALTSRHSLRVHAPCHPPRSEQLHIFSGMSWLSGWRWPRGGRTASCGGRYCPHVDGLRTSIGLLPECPPEDGVDNGVHTTVERV